MIIRRFIWKVCNASKVFIAKLLLGGYFATKILNSQTTRTRIMLAWIDGEQKNAMTKSCILGPFSARNWDTPSQSSFLSKNTNQKHSVVSTCDSKLLLKSLNLFPISWMFVKCKTISNFFLRPHSKIFKFSQKLHLKRSLFHPHNLRLNKFTFCDWVYNSTTKHISEKNTLPFIDLWIVLIQFNWKSKLSKLKDKKILSTNHVSLNHITKYIQPISPSFLQIITE